MPHTTPYKGLGNGFRQAMLKRELQIGCWASLATPTATELLGYAGFDWLLIDGEHAPNDLNSFHMQLLALKDSPSAPVVRMQWNDPVLFKRMLDLGFYNFLIPMVETAEEARRAVAATRYPPHGTRGLSTSQRSNRYGYDLDYFERINESICVTVQIETPLGVKNAAEIAAVEGVDALFIGPQDLAVTYGQLLNPLHPEVQAGMQQVTDACAKQGKAVGILAPIEEDARRYIAMGMTYVAVGSDQGLLKTASKKLADLYR
ncbi:MAG TPA: 2-dehydro-3-deoxyglucarate aldolase [Polaromonas sp.]|uniref:aldolase/citrate lyase family protein n=1 Tax=Polaromonas sp. UBA4122 TaxID=1947074 RepID=UPI000EC50F21|nr:aldolase/citrate lyase family protein [Polaromonas sp. UBA4122]HAL40599.1 2-dehydro-3-deoxyglucarate aldolase [Polaromonas sp.]